MIASCDLTCVTNEGGSFCGDLSDEIAYFKGPTTAIMFLKMFLSEAGKQALLE